MSSYSSKLLINEPPLQLLPSLAVRIGLESAIVLQQIHYWLCIHEQQESARHRRNGCYWVYNTCEKWQSQFRWWSLPTIKRILLELEQMQLVVSERFESQERNQRKWYTINYEVLRLIEQMPDDLWKQKRDERIKLIQSELEQIKLFQSDEIVLIRLIGSKRSIDLYTKITPETTTKITLSPLPPVATQLEAAEREKNWEDLDQSGGTLYSLASLSAHSEPTGDEPKFVVDDTPCAANPASANKINEAKQLQQAWCLNLSANEDRSAKSDADSSVPNVPSHSQAVDVECLELADWATQPDTNQACHPPQAVLPLKKSYRSGAKGLEDRMKQSICCEYEIAPNEFESGFLKFVGNQMPTSNSNMHPEVWAFNHLMNCKLTADGIAKLQNYCRIHKSKLTAVSARTPLDALETSLHEQPTDREVDPASLLDAAAA